MVDDMVVAPAVTVEARRERSRAIGEGKGGLMVGLIGMMMGLQRDLVVRKPLLAAMDAVDVARRGGASKRRKAIRMRDDMVCWEKENITEPLWITALCRDYIYLFPVT